MLPEWMADKPVTAEYRAPKPGINRSRYLSKTLHQMKRTVLDQLVTEEYAGRPGWWQGLDPRIKLVSTLLLIVLAGLTRHFEVILGLWAVTVVTMWLSRLPVLSLQRRIWGLVPLLTLLLAIPAMLNVVVPGDPLLNLYSVHHPVTWWGLKMPEEIYITRQGVKAALFLAGRVGISLSLGVLLITTTPVAMLLKSLQVLRVPSLFVMIIEMCCRYLFLLLNTSIEMFEARRLRTVGNLSLRRRRLLVGSSVGALFIKSVALADEVYLAMQARGYTGQAVSARAMYLKNGDLAWLAGVLVLVGAAITGEFLLG